MKSVHLMFFLCQLWWYMQVGFAEESGGRGIMSLRLSWELYSLCNLLVSAEFFFLVH